MRKISIALLLLIAISYRSFGQFYQTSGTPTTTGSTYQVPYTNATIPNLVGIGTASPISNLTVYTSATEAEGGNVLPMTTAKYGLDIRNTEDFNDYLFSGSTNHPSFVINRIGSYVPPYDRDQIAIDYKGTDFIVDGMGYTGIGTSTPTAQLHVLVGNDQNTDMFM